MTDDEQPIATLTVTPPMAGNTPTLVDTVDGRRVPVQFNAEYDDPTRPFRVLVTIVVPEDRVPVIWELRYVVRRGPDYRPLVSGDPRLPFTSILDSAVDAAEKAAKEYEKASANLAPPRRTRHVLTPAKLDEVLKVVHEAERDGEPIRRAVAEHFRLGSELTARNWIAAARDREKKEKRT